MLEFCRKNKRQLCAVLVYRLDRLSRQTQDYLAIRKKLAECEITLISATEPTGNSPTEKLVETILAGFAQLDNDVRGERTRNGLRARFLTGLTSGPVPIGYLNENGYVIKDPAAFDKVKAAWHLMLTGAKSLREAARAMNDWGLGKNFKGKKYPFRQQSVNRLFRSKFYMGLLTSRRYPEEIRGQHTPMVTSEQFYRVQAILDGRNTSIAAPTVRHNIDNPEFPLRRILKCSSCGVVLTGGWSKGRSARYSYYVCRNRCGTSSVPADAANSSLVEFLKSITLTKDGLNLLNAFFRRHYMQRVAILQKKKAAADTELTKVYALRQTLVEKNLSGVYSDEVFKEQNAILEEKIKDIQVATDISILAKYTLEETTKFIKNKLSDLGKTYEKSLLEQQKVLLGSIFPSGMAWNYPGISNRDIGPLYQQILAFTTGGDSLGDPGGIRTPDLLVENQAS